MSQEQNIALTRMEFTGRELSQGHLPYEKEMEFFQSIKMGSIDEVNRLFKPLDSDELGKLSDDPLQNLKYHLVITIAFITRYCIEGGMEHERAYNLSDVYINRTDKCRTAREIDELHRELVEDYTHKMKELLKNGIYSKPVQICVDHIYKNLHSKIMLSDLAKACGYGATYVSKMFHDEVGETVSVYIVKKRIEEAENLLRYSDDSIADIAHNLGFSTESHFISAFHRYAKITPNEYRKRYFRSRWERSSADIPNDPDGDSGDK